VPRTGSRRPRGKAKRAEKTRTARARRPKPPPVPQEREGRPWATIVLVALSFGVWLSLAFLLRRDLALTAVSGDPWRFVTASLVNDGVAAQFAGVVGIGLFGWLIERRHGPLAVIALFALCGPGALVAASALDPDSLVFGSHGAGLGLLCAWLVPVLLARRRTGGDDDADLLGVMVIAAVLVLVPLLSQGSALAGAIGAGLGAIAGLALAARGLARA
jgi:membrane associated rhomboid family serine protease